MDKAKDFIKHEKSELHKFCYFKWVKFMKISQGKEVTIESRICPAREEIMSNNGEHFKLLVDYILFFMVNELPPRGHDNHDYSANSGNWNNFISLMLKTNPR